MCAISNTIAYGQNLPEDFWEQEMNRAAFRKLMEQANEFDKKTGQPDCEDPEKKRWWNAVEERPTKG